MIKKYTDILDGKVDVLHFAPETVVSQKIRNATKDGTLYITADIEKDRADISIDITNITFKDECFDYVIANHVLEHISDEEKAISEIKKVLKENGKLICSFPICTDIDTFEDENIATTSERLKYYGQEDHVRLYGRDYKERLEAYGFSVQTYSPKDILTDSEIEKYGFLKDDIIIICEGRT